MGAGGVWGATFFPPLFRKLDIFRNRHIKEQKPPKRERNIKTEIPTLINHIMRTQSEERKKLGRDTFTQMEQLVHNCWNIYSKVCADDSIMTGFLRASDKLFVIYISPCCRVNLHITIQCLSFQVMMQLCVMDTFMLFWSLFCLPAGPKVLLLGQMFDLSTLNWLWSSCIDANSYQRKITWSLYDHCKTLFLHTVQLNIEYTAKSECRSNLSCSLASHKSMEICNRVVSVFCLIW